LNKLLVKEEVHIPSWIIPGDGDYDHGILALFLVLYPPDCPLALLLSAKINESMRQGRYTVHGWMTSISNNPFEVQGPSNLLDEVAKRVVAIINWYMAWVLR